MSLKRSLTFCPRKVSGARPSALPATQRCTDTCRLCSRRVCRSEASPHPALLGETIHPQAKTATNKPASFLSEVIQPLRTEKRSKFVYGGSPVPESALSVCMSVERIQPHSPSQISLTSAIFGGEGREREVGGRETCQQRSRSTPQPCTKAGQITISRPIPIVSSKNDKINIIK